MNDHRQRQVLAYLEEAGEGTSNEIAHALGMKPKHTSGVLTRMRRAPRNLVYIHRFVMEDDTTTRRYPRAVYRIGNKPDTPRPPSDPHSVAKRYRDNRVARLLKNNVFNLALTQVQIGVRK